MAQKKDFKLIRLSNIKSNRSKNIFQLKKIFHIPGVLNPADYSSRGESIDHFLKNKLWPQEPPMLKELNYEKDFKLPTPEVEKSSEPEVEKSCESISQPVTTHVAQKIQNIY